jgi:hypothetical protein
MAKGGLDFVMVLVMLALATAGCDLTWLVAGEGESNTEVGTVCEDVPLLVGTDRGFPVETYRQIIYALLPVLEYQEPYSGAGPDQVYNPLWQSTLVVHTINVTPEGHATVELSGQFVPGGACDALYAQAQIERTALAISGVTSVTVVINDESMNAIITHLYGPVSFAGQ